MKQIDQDLNNLTKDRIAQFCVCCGSSKLKNSPAVLMPFVAERVFNWKQIKIDKSWGLKTISKGQTYSICNTLMCSKCNFLFLDIRFSEKELSNLYTGYRNSRYTKLREKYEKNYRKRNTELTKGIKYLDKVEEFIEKNLRLPVSILDWGGDTGKNTPFKNNNKKIHIYDLGNPKTVKGVERVTKSDLKNKKYDLIICSNVLEHVSYPSETLFDIKRNMNSRSLLYIEIPYEKLMIQINNKEKSYLDKKHWHEHVNFFSKKSILNLLKKCKLKVLDFKKLDVPEGNFSLMQIICRKDIDQ